MAEPPIEFAPVFIYAIIVLGFAAGTLIAAHLIGPQENNIVKSMPYESGMDPIGDARSLFDVKYYLVAVVFLVFDVELLFLYPWAATAYAPDSGLPANIGGLIFGVMLSFITTLVIAYVYAWREGVFRWR